MDKLFSHREVEPRVYAAWEEAGVFRARAHVDNPDTNKKPFCIVLPPPNVTGSLHIGHALNVTLQDILIRWKRMQGFDVLWQPGIDHAGIATQMLVERRLAEEEGLARRELGREAFLKRVWQWKEASGDRIRVQMRSLGASCDWQRSRFTMDEGLSAAVRKTFIALYRDGLIYKDKRLVNWDPVLQTAISDLEVLQKPERVSLWHIRYALEGEDGRHITIATTRPETMFADTAIAVHPDDPRYRDAVGRCALLPLLGRRLPIVADAHVDPQQGSGALKVTPGHDFDDFAIGKRHGLEIINVFDATAHLNDIAPPEYRGLERYAARERLVADLRGRGLLEKLEESDGSVPVGDRSGSVIEPWLTDQWYADAPKLAGDAIRVVEEGKVAFVPKSWEKTYFDWMHRIEPWCISRQLWWGHRIPAWYGADGTIFVAENEQEALRQARAHYGEDVAAESLRQDEDVLDTWFSSALWPFSTLGWPEETEELKRYFPTAALVTSFDIIFFWVARMIMFALYFRKDVPFRHVYIHALVRDAAGQKMSKSKGNVIDPLVAVEKYGADALRFTLAALAGQGRDIKLSEQHIEGYRNFATKLWNAARFCHLNECRAPEGFDPREAKTPLNRWAMGKFIAVAKRVGRHLENYRFDAAARELYQFTWHDFCDWYLEFAKGEFNKDVKDEETRACIGWTLTQILSLLHPFMPSITEEIHQRMGAQRLLAASPWPQLPSRLRGKVSREDMEWLFGVVKEIRSARGRWQIQMSDEIRLWVREATPTQQDLLREYGATIERLGKVKIVAAPVMLQDGQDKKIIAVRMDAARLDLSLPISTAVWLERTGKISARLDAEITRVAGQLENKAFLAKAPKHVVQEKRERLSAVKQGRHDLEEIVEEREDDAVRRLYSAAKQGDISAQYELGMMYLGGRGVSQDYRQATQYFTAAAGGGHAAAQYNVGFMYIHGMGVQQDPQQAKRYFLLAAQQGQAKSQYSLGLMYAEGKSVPQNYQEAARYYRLAADQGFAVAQNNLGLMYAEGKGVSQNYQEAERYYHLAAQQGLADAQYNLGFMYERGEGMSQNYQEAARYYHLAARQGVANAQDRLGHMYSDGKGVPRDYQKAVRYYRLAADQGNADAQTSLGFMYAEGKGVSQNYQEAMRYYRLAEQQGYAIAQYNLGCMYDEGTGVQQDKEEAARHFLLAAQQGYAYAQSNLGNMYHNGMGVPQDKEKAVDYYRLAARQGHADAQSNLGVMYAKGTGVPPDDQEANYREAVRYFRLAADQGNAAAQFNLGVTYYYGEGVPRDYQKALHYFTLATQQGLAYAQNNLGLMYADGAGVSQDYQKALHYFTLAAQQDLASAQYNLGLMYANGEGVPQDCQKALHYFTLAAQQGYAPAQDNLGVMYADGEDVPQDYQKALHYFTLAAQQDLASAQYNLGLMYANGEGVPQDYRMAMKWFTRAAQQGLASAQYSLGLMYSRDVLQNHQEAARYYRLAAEQRHAAAQNNLGVMYDKGEGVPQDYQMAVKWFTRAAKQGLPRAQHNLGIMYYTGRGVNENVMQAKEWLVRAGQQGLFRSQDILQEIQEGETSDEEISKSLLLDAILGNKQPVENRGFIT